MTSQAKQIAVGLLLGLLFLPGCAARWMNEYQVDRISNYRVDNLDGDGLWDTGDSNGNGKIDDDESIGTIVDIDQEIPTQALDRQAYNSLIGPVDYSTQLDVTYIYSSSSLILGDFDNDLDPTEITILFFDENSENRLFIGSRGSPNSSIFEGPIKVYVQLDDFQLRSQITSQGCQFNDGLRISTSESIGDEEFVNYEPKSYFEICYGARFFRVQDAFSWKGHDSLFGYIQSDTRANSELAGPQIAVNWTTSKYDWKLHANASLMVGYCNLNFRQLGAVGGGLLSVGEENLDLGQVQASTNRHQDTFFTGLAELNASLARDLSENVSLQVGCNAFYLEQLRNAENSVVWELPNFGISNNKGNDLLISSVYASIEFRR